MPESDALPGSRVSVGKSMPADWTFFIARCRRAVYVTLTLSLLMMLLPSLLLFC